jgi:DNA polymerase eta
VIEKASIDEVFLDLSAMVRELLLERYPYLREVPQSAPHGLNSPLPSPPHITWTARLGHLLSATGLDEAPEDDSVTTWGDVALSIGAELVDDIRTRIREEVGYTTTGGIARNKALAKLVASYRKPNSQV